GWERVGLIRRHPLLELPARHTAVLDWKERHQQKIYYCRLARRNDRAAVDGFRNDQAADKPDGVEERDEEYEISCKTEDERRGFADRPLPMVFSRNCRLSGHRSPPPLA